MRQENVLYFAENEEELINLLFELGIKRNVAKYLCFLQKHRRGHPVRSTGGPTSAIMRCSL